MSDPINHPPHYTAHPSGTECIDVTEHFNFNLGNVIKYIWRCDEKGNPIEDLEKAEFYIRREIERRKKDALPLTGEYRIISSKTESKPCAQDEWITQSFPPIIPDIKDHCSGLGQ